MYILIMSIGIYHFGSYRPYKNCRIMHVSKRRVERISFLIYLIFASAMNELNEFTIGRTSSSSWTRNWKSGLIVINARLPHYSLSSNTFHIHIICVICFWIIAYQRCSWPVDYRWRGMRVGLLNRLFYQFPRLISVSRWYPLIKPVLYFYMTDPLAFFENHRTRKLLFGMVKVNE